MDPLHFFDGDVSIVPVIIFTVIALSVLRSMIFGRRGFRPWRGHRMGKDRMGRGWMPWDEDLLDEEKPQSSPTSAQVERQSPGVEPSEVKIPVADTTIQAHLDKARAYQTQINNLLKSTSDRRARARLQELSTQVNEWIKAIENLAQRVAGFQKNTLIHQDLQSVPKAIAELEARLARESNEATRIELERTLASRKNQLAALEQLQATINRAEIKIESTISALGTIYSQVLTTQSTDQVADYSRLATEVDEELRTLQDHFEALKEVKLGSG